MYVRPASKKKVHKRRKKQLAFEANDWSNALNNYSCYFVHAINSALLTPNVKAQSVSKEKNEAKMFSMQANKRY